MKILSGILFLSFPLWLALIPPFNQEIRQGLMVCRYDLLQDSLEIELEAPTTGWLAVGFNSENNIVGSDLLQFSIQSGKVISEDQFVQAAGVHPTDLALGGHCDIRVLDWKEQEGRSFVRFRIPLHSGDQFDFEHKAGEIVWLILAYSVSDDFEHHSRMRKHVKVKF